MVVNLKTYSRRLEGDPGLKMAVEDGFPALKAEKWMGGLRNSWKEGAAEPPAHVLQERDTAAWFASGNRGPGGA